MSTHVEMMCICTDKNYNISFANDQVCKALGYSNEELIGVLFTTLLPSHLANVHYKFIKEHPPQCNFPKQRFINKMKTFVEENKFFVLLSKAQKVINCVGNISIDPEHMESCWTFEVVKHIDSPFVPKQYLQFINNEPTVHIENYENVCCLMFDLANSTPYVISHTPRQVALLFHNMYVIVHNILSKNFFPYIRLHETCGDNFFMLVNMFDNCLAECTSLSMECGLCIINETNKFLRQVDSSLYLRCGMTYGDISAGVIDGISFRAFGKTVHLASRIEGVCKKDHVAFDQRFMDKLESEQKHDSEELTQSCELLFNQLKGFPGVTAVYHLRRLSYKSPKKKGKTKPSKSAKTSKFGQAKQSDRQNNLKI
jgi:class 3 adenylate cyclase